MISFSFAREVQKKSPATPGLVVLKMGCLFSAFVFFHQFKHIMTKACIAKATVVEEVLHGYHATQV